MACVYSVSNTFLCGGSKVWRLQKNNRTIKCAGLKKDTSSKELEEILSLSGSGGSNPLPRILFSKEILTRIKCLHLRFVNFFLIDNLRDLIKNTE